MWYKTAMTTLQDLSQPLAHGRTADIYAWPGQATAYQSAAQIVKLFLPGESESSVRYEAELASYVAATGMRVPAVGDVVQVDGRFGLLYERIEGSPLLRQLEQRPWQFKEVAQTLAGLQAQIHAHVAPALPQPTRAHATPYYRGEDAAEPSTRNCTRGIKDFAAGQSALSWRFASKQRVGERAQINVRCNVRGNNQRANRY